MAGSGAGSKSLKDYLKRYESNSNEEGKKKNKKKKPVANRATGVLVVDEDPVWQKPVNLEEVEEGNDSPDEEKPQVDEDIEVRRMKRLEQLRLRRPYNAIAEDGSGWISLGPVHQDSKKPDSDMSPPRKQRTRNDSPSPEREQRPPGSSRENTDLSPPQQQRNRQDTPSPESDPKPVHSTSLNSDPSPPHKQKARNDSPSLERKFKPAREGSDLLPPRQQQRRYHTPAPEPDKITGRSTGLDSDLSLLRKQRARNDTPSPKQDHKSVREDTDLSPPRQKRKHNHALLPEPDISLSRQAQRGFSIQDEDLSPPRKHKKDPGNSRPGLTDPSPRSSSASMVPDLSPPRKIQKEEKGVHRTGLISGNDIREEISKKKKEDLLRFQEMDPLVTGRDAEAVYRDKIKGGRISKEEYLKSKEKAKEKPEEKKLEWGKGLAQKRESEARLQELELEKKKPFARTRDDPELDKILKDRLRWGDPMAHLVKRKHSEPVLPDLGENEKMKESGFIIPQDIPSHSWIKRGLDAAPNRYGIKPGRHWDGVDRSNGYEKQLFKRTNEKQATEREAYLWSVADM